MIKIKKKNLDGNSRSQSTEIPSSLDVSSRQEIILNNANSINENFEPMETEIDEKPLLVWEAPTFDDYEPPRYIKMIVLFFFGGIEFYAAVTQNFATFFVILSLAFLIYVYSRMTPDIVQQEICPTYIKIDGQKIYYEEIEKYWIQYDEKVQEITFVVKNKMLNRITSQMGSLNPNLLRALLGSFIEEAPPEPRNLSDYLSRLLHL